MKSEHEKLLDFLKEFSLLDLEKMGEKELNNFINDKKLEIENFRFNQPISFDNNNELYFCRNRIILLYNINQIIDRKKYDILKDMKYCIQQVLIRNFLGNEQIIKNNIYLTFIIILISVPQRKILTDYNLNLIDNKDIDVTDNELKKLGFNYNKSDNTFEYNNIIIQNDKEKMKLYNLKNLNLFINNQNEDIFELHELYKFEELRKYYFTKFDEEKVRTFISKILISNVFIEAFFFFYGDDIKYPFIGEKEKDKEKKALDYLNNYVHFIPFKNECTNAVTEKFSMETYIFLNQELISSIRDNNKKKISFDKNNINKALVNGAIVAIHSHELNHNFHNYYYCSKNGSEPLKTPRKKAINERESGNNMERVLFGRVLNELTLKQIFYILNEDNYKKPLNQFRKEFLELKNDDCKCKGIFKEYSNMFCKTNDLSDYLMISFKNNFLTSKISIKLKDDVLGFPNFYENSYV